ncbi:MAG: hypothetical protein HQ488_04205 [Parcubacteria group bacterium]|nr:hypothetical protein [Parcubacteria group bacterium]
MEKKRTDSVRTTVLWLEFLIVIVCMFFATTCSMSAFFYPTQGLCGGAGEFMCGHGGSLKMVIGSLDYYLVGSFSQSWLMCVVSILGWLTHVRITTKDSELETT